MPGNRIVPYTLAVTNPIIRDDANRLVRRGKNIGKWLVLTFAGLPATYLWTPISCCFRNPVTKMVKYDEDDDRPMEPRDKMAENLGVGMFSAIALVSGGCCCFGCCGSFGPQDV